MSVPRVWLVTGASSGFGIETVKFALSKGDIVVAGVRKPESLSALSAKYSSDQLLVVTLDVTKPTDIASAFETIKTKLGRLDVVFNNAGHLVLGEVETTPDDAVRRVFEVNFFGALHVSQAAVRFFREVNPKGKGGRLIQTSGAGGMTGCPALGFGIATKHALEGMSESLALELDPAWNIKVTIFQPGYFETGVMGAGLLQTPAQPAYQSEATPSAFLRKVFLASGGHHGADGVAPQKGASPAKAAEAIYRLSELPDPPLRLALGEDCVSQLRAKLASVAADIDKYESWSEALKV